MLIGISGKIGSGKDTIGDIIQYLVCNEKEVLASYQKDSFESFRMCKLSNKIQSGWEIKKFADILKDMICMLIGCTREQLEDAGFKNTELGEEWWYWKVYSNIIKDKFELIPYNGKTGFYNRKEDYKGHLLVKPTPRLLLQLLGTDCGRNIIHPDIWVNSLFADYIPKERVIFRAGDYRGVCKRCSIIFSGAKLQPLCRECCFEAPDVYPNWIITDMRFPNELKAVKDREGISIRVNRNSIYKETDTQFSHDIPHPSETALDNAEFDYVIDNSGSIETLIALVKEILIKEKII